MVKAIDWPPVENDFEGEHEIMFVGGYNIMVELTGYIQDRHGKPVWLYDVKGRRYNYQTVIYTRKVI